MIADKHKFIFVHIPKTAGKSVCRVLIERFEDARLVGDAVRCAHLALMHDTLIEYDASIKESLDNFFTFTFVRNPWDRMVSFWKYFQAQKTDGYQTIPNMSFKEFLLNFESVMKCARNDHWLNPYRKHMFTSCQLDFITDKNGEPKINFVGKFENLQEDFNHICKKINIKAVKLPHDNKVSGGWEENKSYYSSQECIDEVAKRYKKDIDFFKYDF